MLHQFENVVVFIANKHNGQIDKSGKPYIQHPMFVSSICKTPEAKIVALLHDVLEDTNTTIEEIKELGLSEKEIEAIVLLTKPEDEDYMHYIKRVAENVIAREVKMCDLKHNMDLSRLNNITEKDMKRNQKYKNAYLYLETFCKN